jgi:putative restriction endonuclease
MIAALEVAVVPEPLVLNTDADWYEHLSRMASGSPARLDEVNFWQRKSTSEFGSPGPGEPVFFRRKAPERAVAGYGFFASHFVAADVYSAWSLLGEKNGAPTLGTLARQLQRDEAGLRRPLGCLLLREAVFWADPRWIPWDERRGWKDAIVVGRRERGTENARVLLQAVARDGVERPSDLAERFRLVPIDARTVIERPVVAREGQGTFRARVLDAWGGACAITGEHTEPVLQAAHIQPYRGPESNHVQNGLLLTSEFHTLFDRGLVAVEPPGAGRRDYHVRVSTRIREKWQNGRRYNDFDGRPLVGVPRRPELLPSREALEWHRENIFERVA